MAKGSAAAAEEAAMDVVDGEGIGGGGGGGCDGCGGWGGWNGHGWVWDPSTGEDNHPQPDPQNCPGTCWVCMDDECVNMCWCEIHKPGTMYLDNGWATIGDCSFMSYPEEQYESEQCRNIGDQCMGWWYSTRW